MAKNVSSLTPREEAAVRLYLYEGEDLSPVFVYKLAHRGSLEEVEHLADIAASASRWIRSKKVLQYMNEQRAIFNDRRDKERMKIESEVTARIQASADPGKHTVPGFVDYSQPSAQLAKLNELINTASDPGEVLDAMKVLLSKQAELAPARAPEKQQRFYLPLCCTECHIKAIFNEIRLNHPDLQARLHEVSDIVKSK